MHPVLHRVAQPIRATEFLDALRAAAAPRFPHARVATHRKVALGISGGVDSMALAYLCARSRRVQGDFKVGDFPVHGFAPLVIDHGLRAGSGAEARAVADELARMGLAAQVWPIRWKDALAVARLAATGQTKGPSPAVLDALATLSTTAAAQDPPVSPLAALLAARDRRDRRDHRDHRDRDNNDTIHNLLGSGALETLARRLRYYVLARRAALSYAVSLLLAHHEDDQYETVLMRLLSGYGLHGGPRGLRGMRAAADIPECRGFFGVHQSGFVDDQRQPSPSLLLQPTRAQRRRIKRAFRADHHHHGQPDEGPYGVPYGAPYGDALCTNFGDALGAWGAWGAGDAARGEHFSLPRSSSPAPPLAPLDTEDLGLMVYRPLLGFAKARLVATCQANGIAWFEDHTNHDPTLTLRNALRHLVTHHADALPRALQKPAILQLAARCHAAASQHEAEARRWMARHQVLVRFTDNVGTLVVALPPMDPPPGTAGGQTRRGVALSPRSTRGRAPRRNPSRARAPRRRAPTGDPDHSRPKNKRPRTATKATKTAGRRHGRETMLWNRTGIDQGPVLRGTASVARTRHPQSWVARAARQKRRAHKRMIAALVVQNMLSFVTPEDKLTPVTQLQATVDTLFPDLSDRRRRAHPPDRKGFSLCGVHFIPLPGPPEATGPARDGTTRTTPRPTTAPAAHDSTTKATPRPTATAVRDSTTKATPRPTTAARWYLVRAPYPTQDHRHRRSSTTTTPTVLYKPTHPADRVGKPVDEWPWTAWRHWVLYDGRFWIRVRVRLPAHVCLEPFHADHAKRFRDSLMALCGSSRWDGGVSAGEEEESDRGEKKSGRGERKSDRGEKREEKRGEKRFLPSMTTAAFQATLKKHAPGKVRFTLPALYVMADIDWVFSGADPPREVPATLDSGEPTPPGGEISDPGQKRLVALPTLGVYLPGMEQWIQWEVRYRKVDMALLESSCENGPPGWA